MVGLYVDRPKDCPDADVVATARRAGAVPWGKTNVPVMLGDWQSITDVYGTTNNPYDVSRTPGGSSGGAATALAGARVALWLDEPDFVVSDEVRAVVLAAAECSRWTVGAQLVGKWAQEDRLLDLADALERATGGFHSPPGQ